MGKSLNLVQLIGNVGADPDVRMSPGGVLVVKFNLATNRTIVKRTGEKVDVPSWHRCTVFDKLGEIVRDWVHVGDRIYVQGRIEQSETERDVPNCHCGCRMKQFWTEIIVHDVVLLGSPKKENGAPAPAGVPGERSSSPFEAEDDLPF